MPQFRPAHHTSSVHRSRPSSVPLVFSCHSCRPQHPPTPYISPISARCRRCIRWRFHLTAVLGQGPGYVCSYGPLRCRRALLHGFHISHILVPEAHFSPQRGFSHYTLPRLPHILVAHALSHALRHVWISRHFFRAGTIIQQSGCTCPAYESVKAVLA